MLMQIPGLVFQWILVDLRFPGKCLAFDTSVETTR
jgi:hypothetical protein